MASSYSSYSLNLNTRALVIDESKYNKLLSDLETQSKSDNKYVEILKSSIMSEYDDYISNKNKSKRELQGRRRLEFGPLLGDRHGLLVSYGCCLTEYKDQYTINLLENLDIVIAISFNIPLTEVREKLNTILNKHNITLKYISVLFLTLTSDDEVVRTSPITIEDLCIFKEIEDYLLNLIKQEMYQDVPILSNIDGANFLDIFEVDDTAGSALPIALMLKFLSGASSVMKYIVTDFYSLDVNGIIISQDFCSITFAVNSPLTHFTYYGDKEEFVLPLQKIV